MTSLGGTISLWMMCKNNLTPRNEPDYPDWIREPVVWLRNLSSSKFPWHQLVHVTPDPSFSRLDGTDQRMLSFVKMLGCMLVFGRVATANLPANKAQAEVDPLIAHLHTFLTDMLFGLSNFDLIKMGTLFRH